MPLQQSKKAMSESSIRALLFVILSTMRRKKVYARIGPLGMQIVHLPKGTLAMHGTKSGFDKLLPGPFFFNVRNTAKWYAEMRKLGQFDSANIVSTYYGCRGGTEKPVLTFRSTRKLRLLVVNVKNMLHLRDQLKATRDKKVFQRCIYPLDYAFFGSKVRKDLPAERKRWYATAGAEGKDLRPRAIRRNSTIANDTAVLLSICKYLRLDGYIATSRAVIMRTARPYPFHPEAAVCNGASAFERVSAEDCDTQLCRKLSATGRTLKCK